MQSILLIFFLQVRFHLDFQEAITHRRFITLSVILASPLKLTMAFKELFTRHFVFFRFLNFFLFPLFSFLLINIFFFCNRFDLFSHRFQIFFMGPMTFIPGSLIISFSPNLVTFLFYYAFLIVYFQDNSEKTVWEGLPENWPQDTSLSSDISTLNPQSFLMTKAWKHPSSSSSPLSSDKQQW